MGKESLPERALLSTKRTEYFDFTADHGNKENALTEIISQTDYCLVTWSSKMYVFEDKTTTVKILCIGTDRSQQTVQTKIRLLLKKQSDQGLRCLPLHQLLLDALMQCYIKLTNFRTIMAIVRGVPNFRIFTVSISQFDFLWGTVASPDSVAFHLKQGWQLQIWAPLFKASLA